MARTWTRAARWVDANLAEFCVEGRGLDDEVLARLKPVGELALVASCLLDAEDREGAHRRAREWLAHAWDAYARGRLIVDVLEARPDLVALGTVYPSFRRHGFRDARVEAALRRAVGTRAVAALEFPAWRALDLATACAALDLPSPWRVRPLARRTWLARHPEPWLLTDDVAYSVTHTVFYLTAFGRRPRGLPAETRAYLRRFAPAWMAYYALQPNWDLYAELGLARLCAGESAVAAEVESTLAAAQEKDGVVPGPEGGGESLASGATTRARRRFARHYHTTLVSLLASHAATDALRARPRARACRSPR